MIDRSRADRPLVVKVQVPVGGDPNGALLLYARGRRNLEMVDPQSSKGNELLTRMRGRYRAFFWATWHGLDGWINFGEEVERQNW